jgi:Kef-type K+ transport system membrane component KefB
VPDLSELARPAWISAEVIYVLMLFMLFVVPRFLQRYRIPSAVTALVFGIIAGPVLGWLHDDQTVNLLSTLGIVSLFLFAGLDVAVEELRREARVLAEHVIVRAAALGAVAWAAAGALDLNARPALLVSLALMTPSTGFILDSLAGWVSSDRERFWIRSKAIATELVALAVLFVTLQSTSWSRLGLSALILAVMVALLPIVLRWLASTLIPYAPKSEFGFLVIVAVTCALITRGLGVYYLVGAFVVGMAAQRFRQSLPNLASERMIGSVEAFASLFIPFYFFHAGAALVAEDFSVAALGAGVAFLLLVVPLRLGLVAAHRKLRLGEDARTSMRIGVAVLPTTVFALVIVDILRDRFEAPPYLLGGLVIYAVVTTIVPGLFFRAPTMEYEDELLLGERTAGAHPHLPAP